MSTTQPLASSHPLGARAVARPPWEGALGHACDNAAASGHAWLLRAEVALDLEHPAAILPTTAAERERDAPWAAWHDEPGGLSFASLGSAWSEPLGADAGAGTASELEARFNQTKAACSRIREHTVSSGELADLPLCIAGFRFGGLAEGRGPWRGWPAALVVVPRTLAYLDRRTGRAGLVHHLKVDPGTAQSAARAQLRAELDEVLGRLGHRLPSPCGRPARLLRPDGELGWPDWQALVLMARGALHPAGLRKLVVARQVTLRGDGALDAVATFHRLVANNHGQTTFAVALPGAGVLVGSSPETLVRVRGRRVATQAVAGTAPANTPGTCAELGSDKNLLEHRLVVDGIRERLAPLCERLLHRPRPRVVRLADVAHLVTPVVGRLAADRSLLDAVAALHPTPALGGYPACEAAAWLARYEGLDRGWYGAPLGWVAPSGDGAFVVAIRSALLRDDQAHAFVGAGIVPASEPRAEWQETEQKLRTALGGLAERGER